MDRQRTQPTRSFRRHLPRIAAGVVVVLVLLGLTRLRPASQVARRDELWLDTVTSGPLTRVIRAPGTLVPEELRIVSAVTAGRIERILVQPGEAVNPSTVLVEIVNPDVELQALDADRQLASAASQLAGMQSALATAVLQQRAAIAAQRTATQVLIRRASVAETLSQRGFVSALDVASARDSVLESEVRTGIEDERLSVLQTGQRRQVAFEEANVTNLRAMSRFYRQRLADMRVPAADSGVVQDLSLTTGQWVVPGQILARIAKPGRLKAVLRVPETQARELVAGQRVTLDVRSGGASSIIEGAVMRVDPAVQAGSVTVEVRLTGAVRADLRTDQSVDGTIIIERLPQALHIARPVATLTQQSVQLFVLERDGQSARRVPVTLGRGAGQDVEIISGLRVGDVVIVSDVSRWDGQSRIDVRD
jgi:HlyD family secretion protein